MYIIKIEVIIMMFTAYMTRYALDNLCGGRVRVFAWKLKVPTPTLKRLLNDESDMLNPKPYNALLSLFGRHPDKLREMLYHFDEHAANDNQCLQAYYVRQTQRAFLMDVRKAAANSKVDQLGFMGLNLIDALEAGACGINKDGIRSCPCFCLASDSEEGTEPKLKEGPCQKLHEFSESLQEGDCPCCSSQRLK